jgi:hypothetical protein
LPGTDADATADTNADANARAANRYSGPGSNLQQLHNFG